MSMDYEDSNGAMAHEKLIMEEERVLNVSISEIYSLFLDSRHMILQLTMRRTVARLTYLKMLKIMLTI